RSEIVSFVTPVTVASRATPLTMKVTRVVDVTLVGQARSAQKRPPWRVSGVPPVEGPKLGSQKDTKGPAPAAADWNTMVIVAEPVCPFDVAEARTTAVPGNSEQSAVRAAPFWVTTEIRGSEVWAKTPKWVEKDTAVPSATG